MKHSKYGIVNWFVRLALDGQPLTVFGDGQQHRDYIFNEDLAEGCLALMLSPGTEGRVYNLGAGVAVPFIEMARLVAAAVPGTELRQVAWPQDRYFVETGDYISDITRITAATGWRPKTTHKDGIERTVAYYREHQKEYW
jgi:nucleoside-diphosphate-sugar epimerase